MAAAVAFSDPVACAAPAASARLAVGASPLSLVRPHAVALPARHRQARHREVRRLRAYRWPGNVRELENMVRRLAALYSQEVIGVDAVEAELAETLPSVATASNAVPDSLGSAIERHLRDYFTAHESVLPPAGLYGRVLKEMERPLITLTLEATRGNQIKAAQLLGVNRNTLRKKIRELDIEVVRGVK